MRGLRRLILFCVLTAILPTILVVVPLYLRHSLYSSVTYAVSESDIMEIDDGISTIFCSGHSLSMNSTFNAYKVGQRPQMTGTRKHIRLQKSMTLPDDTLEYWGFYLLKGSTVALSVCSRFQGASILVVKGERNLRTCGMRDHNQKKARVNGDLLPKQAVKVTFQTNAQEIRSGEIIPKDSTPEPSPFEPREQETKSSPFGPREEETKPFAGSEKGTQATKGTDELEYLERTATAYVRKQRKGDASEPKESEKKLDRVRNKLREALVESSGPRSNKVESKRARRKRLAEELEADEEVGEEEGLLERAARNVDGVKPKLLLDRGPAHGGNAGNFTVANEESSVSSFENGLLTCYDGQVLLAQEFEPSNLCVDVNFLTNTRYMETRHDVVESGYYYYIFYSDNDFVSNDIHAVFDIYKPSFQYENVTQMCVNATECSFNLGFLSSEFVIVEVPMKNGIEHEETDVNLLVSTCHPRMGLYTVFPIAAILLILGCAFI